MLLNGINMSIFYFFKCKKFGSLFSCQSLLLGTNVPNDSSTVPCICAKSFEGEKLIF